jgi:hypothetical protein
MGDEGGDILGRIEQSMKSKFHLRKFGTCLLLTDIQNGMNNIIARNTLPRFAL